MARVTQVEYGSVAQACAELLRAGESVSFAKVYQRLGSKGGQQVVSDMIRRWRQDLAQRLLAEREHPQLPPSLVQASDALIAQLWPHALSEARAGYQQQVEALARREADWQAKLDSAQAHVDQVDRDNLEIQAALARAQGEGQAREAAHQELAERHQALQGQLAEVERERAQAREQAGQLQATLQAERQRHTAEVEAVKGQHAAELRQIRLQADADRKHFMLQTDELRQAHRAQAEALREQLEGARVALDASRQRLDAARESSSRWQGRAEVAQQELAGLKAEVAKTGDEAARWRGRAEALQEMLAVARQPITGPGEPVELEEVPDPPSSREGEA